MTTIGVLPSLRKKKHSALVGFLPYSCLRAMLRYAVPAAFLVIISFAPALAAGGTEMGTGRSATIGTDPATGDKVMSTPPPVPQEQNQGPQTIIVSPEVDLRRPGYGPTPPRPYPPGPRPYGPSAPGAPYPGPRR